jgi:hypothetical protein
MNIEDSLIKMQTCGNIFGDKILTKGQAKGCLLIATSLIIEALKSNKSEDWISFKKDLENYNIAEII